MVIQHSDGWRAEDEPDPDNEKPEFDTGSNYKPHKVPMTEAEENEALDAILSWQKRHPRHDFPIPGATYWIKIWEDYQWLAVPDDEGTPDSTEVVLRSSPEIELSRPGYAVWMTVTCSLEQVKRVVETTTIPNIQKYDLFERHAKMRENQERDRKSSKMALSNEYTVLASVGSDIERLEKEIKDKVQRKVQLKTTPLMRQRPSDGDELKQIEKDLLRLRTELNVQKSQNINDGTMTGLHTNNDTHTWG
jgi:hypothetical protein